MWRCGLPAALAGLSPLLSRRRQARCEAAAVRSPQAEQPGQSVFVTYNVLSSHLAPPNKYRRCDPEDLHAPTRLERLQSKLRGVMEQQAVIGLQEVSTDWAGELHVFFARQGYQMVFAGYGEPFNGYMGVLLAYPERRFEAKKVKLHHVCDSLPPAADPPAPKVPKELAPYGILSPEGLAEILQVDPESLNPNARRSPRGPTLEVLTPRKDREWGLAGRRRNMAILARLHPLDARTPDFCIGVYHNPCLYATTEDTQSKNIHTLALRAELANFAEGDPCVLLGDFNFTPGSSGYQLYSGSPLGSSEEAPATELYARIFIDYPLRSAYATVHKREPCARMLDYVWVSKEWKVKECPRIEARVRRPSPNEPSDHPMLLAVVELPTADPEVEGAAESGEERELGEKRRP